MELVYFWINTSDNGILKKQDVMLSDEYEISYDGEKFLNIKESSNYYNIFQNNVISNVNAVVGTNGAGKTTLLQYIYSRDVQPYKTVEGEILSEFDMNFCDSRRTIQVYIDDKKLLIIHNIKEGLKVTGLKSCEIINTYENKKENSLEEIIPITKIYLTNSSYNNGINGYTTAFGEPTDIALTMQSITTFGNGFYSNMVNFPENAIEDNWYNGLQQIIISKRNEEDFQKICDLMYFNKLYKDKMIESFSGKIPTKLVVQVKSLLRILREIENRKEPVKSYRSSLDYGERIKNKEKKWRNIFGGDTLIKSLNNCTIIEQLEINLIFELDFIYDILENCKQMIKENVLEYCAEYLEKVNDNEMMKNKNYYVNAIKEINGLKSILKEGNKYREIVLDYNILSEEYLKFCEYIEHIVDKGESFILKYLKIDNLGLSSGERAYLNFFSWLNLLTFFKKISSNNIYADTKNNILLLIDEIDLYCHPEWQRKMVKDVLEQLKLQFPNKKIQIIFTTHSPIVLSDIPLTNTLYIRKTDDGLSRIDDRSTHKETFSSNIYQLFNDSFFLKDKSAIGEYALNVINDTLNKIKKGNIDDNLSAIEAVLNIIGEPIIRNKLANMLNKKLMHSSKSEDIRYTNNDIKEDDKIIKIKKCLEELLKEIGNIE